MSRATNEGGGETRKLALLTVMGGGAFAADVVTKLLVKRSFDLYEQVAVVGEYVRLTLLYNEGAAFGLSFGAYSRPGLIVITTVLILGLLVMFARTPSTARSALIALSLVIGGALANLLDRLAPPAGVTDWIDVGLGGLRWPVFNLADAAITIGVIVLAGSMWREPADRRTSGIS